MNNVDPVASPNRNRNRMVLLGIFAGPLLICVGVAVSRWRCPGLAMLAGILLGWAAGVYVSLATPVARLWVPPVSAGVTLIVAMCFSPFVSARQPRGFDVVRGTREAQEVAESSA